VIIASNAEANSKDVVPAENPESREKPGGLTWQSEMSPA